MAKEKNQKPVIGIVGGIGSGKSTVAAEFGKLGCAVIDADRIAHELLEEDFVKQSVTKKFGENVLDESGHVDRKKIAAVVFDDERKLAFLTDLIHPIVLDRSQGLIEKYQASDDVKAIVLDMPLLLEVGWEKKCDNVIFVRSEKEKRLQRLGKKGLAGEKEYKKRENFQISLDSKAEFSDNTVDNNSDLSALAGQVAKIFAKIIEET